MNSRTALPGDYFGRLGFGLACFLASSSARRAASLTSRRALSVKRVAGAAARTLSHEIDA